MKQIQMIGAGGGGLEAYISAFFLESILGFLPRKIIKNHKCGGESQKMLKILGCAVI